ncbi:MAG TPA: SDR family oxidoreductase [Sphingomicrobium sp.]|nr:SDR family oxidoreductase [Sphingomicrobium sp.]
MSQVAVITGASAGIGRATSREFARQGCRVALIARGRDGLEAAAREVEELGGEALVIEADVADHVQVDAAAEKVIARFGQIDIWVNNAFAGIFSRFMDMSAEEYRRVTDVTYMGQVHGTRAALRHMLPRNRGAIVLVGSALAYRGIPLQSAYCGAKHAVQGFLDSVRSELLHMDSAVRLTMVQLPGVNTPQFDWIRAHVSGRPKPVGPVYQPEVAARAIWKAANSSRKEWMVGAPAYQAILGNKLLSPLLDRYLARTAVDGQQSEVPVEGDRRDNLFDPVPGDHGAHGRFGDKARERSPLLWASEHRGWIAAGAALAVGASLLGLSLRDREKINEPG